MTREAAIAEWLPRARWFAGKSDRSLTVAIHDAATLPGTSLDAALVDVAQASECVRYWVPLDGAHDAATTATFARWLVHAILQEATLPARHGTFHGHALTAGGPARTDDGQVVVAPLGGDATNTSFVVNAMGRRFAVKLLRRCRAGIQPEVEIGEFLGRSDWNGTPRLCGWLDYHAATGDSTALATLHEFAPGAVSAWDRLVALVTQDGPRGDSWAVVLGLVAALGRMTAEMHRALASRSDVAAFAPERPTADAWRSEAARMQAHAAAVVERAVERLPALPEPLAAQARRLIQDRDRLVGNVGRLATLADPAAWIRVHGDYHLGQVLVCEPDSRILVIDFEGEPGRSLDERRRKTSAFKDVAGMCRSFDYLVRHAARIGHAPHGNGDVQSLEAGFLEAYRAVAEGEPWWPTDSAAASEMLRVYKLDKALYELAYELANRPDWVEVPLAALLETA